MRLIKLYARAAVCFLGFHSWQQIHALNDRAYYCPHCMRIKK